MKPANVTLRGILLGAATGGALGRVLDMVLPGLGLAADASIAVGGTIGTVLSPYLVKIASGPPSPLVVYARDLLVLYASRFMMNEEKFKRLRNILQDEYFLRQIRSTVEVQARLPPDDPAPPQLMPPPEPPLALPPAPESGQAQRRKPFRRRAFARRAAPALLPVQTHDPDADTPPPHQP